MSDGIQLDKLQRVLNGILDRVPVQNESDLANLRSDVATIDVSDENVTTDPATVSAANPAGVVETPAPDPITAFTLALRLRDQDPPIAVDPSSPATVTVTDSSTQTDSVTQMDTNSANADSTATVVTPPTVDSASIARSNIDSFLATASDTELESLDAYIKTTYEAS